MPIYDPNPDGPDLQAQAQASQASINDRAAAAQYAHGNTLGDPVTATAGLVVGSVSDLVDTASSSVGLSERQSVNNAFLNAIGRPGVSSWFDQNRGAVEIGSGVLGTIASSILADGVLNGAGKTMQFLRGVPYVGRIAQLDEQYQTAVRIAKITAAESAATGATGIERFIGSDMTFGALDGGKPLVISPGKAAANVFSSRLVKGLATNVLTEGIMGATMNTNRFLYSDDLSHNIAWAGAGLVLGAGVDSLVSAYTLRKIANSDRIRSLNAGAYDVSGLESNRLGAFDLADTIAKAADGSPQIPSYLFKAGGATTDKITSLAVDAAQLTKSRGFSDSAMSLFRKREAIATPKLNQAFEELNKVTTSGIQGVSKSGFSTTSEGLGDALKSTIYRDQTSMYGIEEIGTVGEDMTRDDLVKTRQQNLLQRQDQVGELLKNDGKWINTTTQVDGVKYPTRQLIPLADDVRLNLQNEAKQIGFSLSHTPLTMIEPGEWAPMSLGKVADGYEPRNILKEGLLGADENAIWQRAKTTAKEPTQGISATGDLFLPKGKTINSMGMTDMLDLYHTGNKMVRDMASAGQKMVLPDNPNWFHLDLAENLIKQVGDDSAVRFPGAMTRQDAQVESFAQKVDAIRSHSNLTGSPSETDAFAAKTMFNLPRISSYQQGLMGGADGPVDILLNGFKTGAEVRAAGYQGVLQGLNDSRKIMGLTEDTSDSLSSLSGRSFNFLLDEDGNAIKPMVAFRRPLMPAQWSQDELLVRQTMRQAQMRESLVGPTADPVTSAITNAIINDPNSAEARKVMELGDDQSRSWIPGFRDAAPQTTSGSLINALTPKVRRDVDNLTMLAASKVKDLESRVTQETMRKIVQQNMGDSITQIMTARNAASKLLLDQFHSFRQGWDLVREPVPTSLPGGDGFAFALDHESVGNQQRFKQAYGQELTKDQVMLNPQGKPVVMDQIAMDVLTKMQTIHEMTVDMKNTLLRSQNLNQLQKVPWYAPPASLKGKYVGYTFDAENNVVPGMTMVADSPEGLTKMAGALVKSDQWKNGYAFRQRQEVESFMTLWDKAQMDFATPNTTAIMPGKTNFGRTGGNTLNTNAFQDALVTMRDSMVKHGSDIIDTLYDDVIKSARSRAAISRVESGVGSRNATQYSSIYDRFLQNLTGQSSLSAKDSFFGDAMHWVEQKTNGLLQNPVVSKTLVSIDKAKAAPGDVYGLLRDQIMTSRPGDKPSEARFNLISQALGPYMPFKDASELAAASEHGRVAPNVAAITNKLSWFEASSRLRWLESMHAVANIGGIISNMPAVIRNLQPRLGETIEDAARRNSSLVMMVKTPGGNDVNLPNVPKLLWNSMKDAWAKAPDEFTTKAIARGYMDQEVDVLNRQWNSIEDAAGWKKYVFGDHAHEGDSMADKFVRNGGIDRHISILSDKSEAFTRQWSLYAGRRVADSLGIKNVDDQLAFAHDIANNIIANFDPRNRPELFQGALGAPIGLFQTHIYQFYNRMFRYIETGNGRAVATQAAYQSAVFGIGSLPGYDAMKWAFGDHGQGAHAPDDNGQPHDPVDSIYQRFGHAYGDLIMHGTIANLPKLLNALPGVDGVDGSSVDTRRDMLIRPPLTSLAMADTAKRIYNGIGQAVDSITQTGGLSKEQVAEILSNVTTNRPLGGMLEVFGAHGYDTDASGQVAAQSVGLMNSTYRILGIRSMQQQQELSAYYENKQAMAEQMSRSSTINEATRAAIRGQNWDSLPGLFNNYVQNGGDPRKYSSWLNKSFADAHDTRAEKQLTDALRDPNNTKTAYVQRLMDSQVGINDDEQASQDAYGADTQAQQLAAEHYAATPEPANGIGLPPMTRNGQPGPAPVQSGGPGALMVGSLSGQNQPYAQPGYPGR